MPLTSGVHLGPYEIYSLLRAGGMGEVYRGRDPRLGRDVAIKVLPSNASSDPARLQRFEQEARAAAALNHPNILAVYDVGVHDGAPYIVSELLEGQTLRARLASGALPVRTALDYAKQIAQGLAAAHEKGIVHRDLKPDNVFVTADGHVKLLDFGLASLIEQELTGPISTTSPDSAPRMTFRPMLGAPLYMSPEQVLGGPVDLRTDVYSLGVVLFEMLTGRHILGLESIGEAKMSPALERLLRRCVDRDPARRFESTQELASALSTVSTATTSPADAVAPAPVPAQPAPKKRRPGLPIAAMVFVALAIGAIVAMVNGC